MFHTVRWLFWGLLVLFGVSACAASAPTPLPTQVSATTVPATLAPAEVNAEAGPTLTAEAAVAGDTLPRFLYSWASW